MRYRITLAEPGLYDPITLSDSDAHDLARDLSQRHPRGVVPVWTADGQRLIAVYYDGRALWEAGEQVLAEAARAYLATLDANDADPLHADEAGILACELALRAAVAQIEKGAER